jgi:hypothetical protein
MLNTIRTAVARYRLKNEASTVHKDRKMTNLEQARRIGVLYILDDVPDYDVVSAFVTELQHDRKEVKALGFVKNKNLVTRFLPKLSYDFFSSRDVSFFYRPVHTKVRDFTDQEFDILIDLSLKENIPLRYIAALSSALCRVGMFSDEDFHCYDLMIDPAPGLSLKEYIDHIIHYLTVINADAKGTR